MVVIKSKIVEDVMSKSNQNSRRRKSKKAARKKRNRIILFSIEFLVCIVVFIILWFTLKLGKIQTIDIGGFDEEANNGLEVDPLPPMNGKDSVPGYKLIALFGVDSREGELKQNTRSDTIMIACLNEQTKEIRLLSVYRDTYLNLSNDTYNKCNAAYSKGGGNQAIAMLNMNLDLNIDAYMTVGFKGLVDTVDSLGGVPIDIHEDEIQHLNSYQSFIAGDLNRQNQFKPVTNTGLQTLTGLQACGYCRIRYTAGSDFKRTERQRTVLTEMLNQAKKMSLTQVNDVANSAFPNIISSMDSKDILKYVADYADYKIGKKDGFPFEENRGVANVGKCGSCVIPLDLKTNVIKAHEFLFDETDYVPSETVIQCSEKIKEDTTSYLADTDLMKLQNNTSSGN